MRKSIFILTLAGVAGLTVSARSLDPAEALGRALGQPSAAVSRSASAPELVMTIGSDNAPALYVFNRADNGYMIVSADDVAVPVIGYSDNGSFDPENMPENLRYWLQSCGEEITKASAAGLAPYAETVSRAADREQIAPLMATTWDQGAPYNKYCPKIGSQATYTGCVATAMAQVMKYFNWPEKASANANLTYQWYNGSVVTLSEDFSNYEFDWDNMLDSYSGGYSTAQADAVAKLMQACGYSVTMSYGTNSSGAFAAHVGKGLVDYFKYDSGLHNEARELYSASQWEEMIYNNLRDFGPIVYWGSGNGSHCFVCDGYQGNGYYHFNWGWSGMSDGWYRLNMLTPGSTGIGGSSGGFNNGQGVLLGVKPAGDTVTPRVYTFYASRGVTEVYTYEKTLSLYGNFWNFSPYNVNAKFGMSIYAADADGKDGKYISTVSVDVPYDGTFYSNNYENAFSANMPASLANGVYNVYPVVNVDGKEYTFRAPAGYANYVVCTIDNGNMTARIPEVVTLTVDDLSTNGNIYLGSRFMVSGTAKFDGVGEVDRQVVAVLLRPDGTVCGTGSSSSVKFSEDGTYFEFVSNWFSGSDIQVGDYTFALQYNNKTIASCAVTIAPATLEGQCQIISCKVLNAELNPQFTTVYDVTVCAEVKGIKGVVDGTLAFWLTRQITPVGSEVTAPFFVSEGQTTKVTASIRAYNPLTGWPHTLYCQQKSNGSKIGNIVSYEFSFDDDFSGISDVEADADAPVEYFNLQGVRVDSKNLVPGIYIRRQGAETAKILVK